MLFKKGSSSEHASELLRPDEPLLALERQRTVVLSSNTKIIKK